MATLEKIRTRGGVFITVIIGIALLSFLVNPQDIIQYFQSSRNTVGEIDGRKIDYQKYQEKIDYYTQIATIQSGQAPQEDESERIRNQAWEKMIFEYYLSDQFENVGLGVSEKELGDLATGTNLSPIMRSFGDFVNPQTGEIYRENIQFFWQNPDNNPQRQMLITYLEDEIRSYALMTKYLALVNKANYINSLETKRSIANAANSVEFNYIVQRYMGGAEADSLYRIKESEAKDYYNKYKKRWEQQESRDIEMVIIPIIPTQEDNDATKATVEKLIPEFAASTNLQQFVQFNSDNRQPDYAYHKQGELPTELNDFAFSSDNTGVYGPYLDGNAYKIARVEDSRMIPDSVFFREIMINVTSQEHLSLADSITTLLKNNGGASWAEVALKYSSSPQASMNGGEVGWVSYNTLPYPLSDSCFLNPTGKVMSMPTQNGMYIFQASQKSRESKMVRMAVVEKAINPSKRTDEVAYGKASQLASLSQDGLESFRKAVQENGYTAQPATNIMPGSKQVLTIQNAQPITRWLYEADVKVNSISPVINVNQAYYIVAVITAIREEGIAPFDQVKASIGEELRKEKQAEAFAAKMKEAAASSSNLEGLASTLNLDVLQVTSPVTFGSNYAYSSYIPGLGLEPKVAAAATTISELNKLSEPIVGNAGVYVLSLTDKRTDEGYTEAMAKGTLSQGFAMKQMDWYGALLRAGDVKDYRAKFF